MKYFLFLLMTTGVIAQSGSNQIRLHDTSVVAIALSPDGKTLVTADEGGLLKWSNVVGGELLKSSSDAKGSLRSVAFSMSGHWVAAGGDDQAVYLYDAQSRELMRTFGKTQTEGLVIGTPDIWIHDLKFSPDEKFIAIAGEYVLARRYQIKIFEASSGSLVKTITGQSGITGIAFSPDGKQIASTDGDGRVQIWDIDKANLLRTLGQGLGYLNAIAWSSDGRWIATGGSERSVTVYDAHSGVLLGTLFGHSSALTGILFVGNTLITSSQDHCLIAWNPETMTEIRRLTFSAPALCTASDGRWLATGLSDGKVQLTELETMIRKNITSEITDTSVSERVIVGEKSPFVGLKEMPVLTMDAGVHGGIISAIAFAKNDKEIVTASRDKTIRMWNASDGSLIRTLHMPAYPGAEGELFCLAVSPDNKLIVAAGSSVGQRFNKTTENYIGDYVLLIDYASGKILDAAANHKQSIYGVAFSPNGLMAASCAGAYDNQVNLYNVDRSRGKLTLADQFNLSELAKKENACRDDGFGKVLDVCEHPVTSVRFLPDSNELVAGDYHGLVWRLTPKKNGAPQRTQLLGSMLDHNGVRTLAVDPSGQFVVAGDLSGRCKVFEIMGGESLSIATFKNAPVRSASISGDGKVLAIGVSNEARVYEISSRENGKRTKKLVQTFKNHSGEVSAVTISIDGSTVVSADENFEIYVWDSKTGAIRLNLGLGKKAGRLSAVGVCSVDPFLIGIGHHSIPDGSVNNYGAIEKGFDMFDLKVVPDITAKTFMTALASGFDAYKRPPFKALLNDDMVSYLPLGNGHTLIGSLYGLFLDNPFDLMDLEGTRGIALAESPDRSTAYAAFEDGEVQIYDEKSLKRLATLHIGADNEWILWTPDGFYTASKAGAKSVGWLINQGVRQNPKYYPFEQFDLRLNRPDIVLARLGGISKNRIRALQQAYQRRLRKMGLDEKTLANVLQAPELEVGAVAPEAKQKKIPIKVKASDDQFNLDRLLIFVNDVPIFGSQGLTLRASNIRSFSKTIDIELNSGDNKIQVSVLNSAGIESFKETRRVRYDGPATLPTRWIVAIGVSDYQDATMNLRYAAKDANDLTALLGGPTAHVLRLTDKNATRENILKAKDFLSQSGIDDEVVLFIAGHGLLDDKLDWYFATHDIDFNNPSARGVSYDALEGLLDGISARKKIMLMDACNSGEVDKESSVLVSAGNQSAGSVKSRGFKTKLIKRNGLGFMNSFELMQGLFTDLQRGSGAQVIASASGAEYAWESADWNNGIFTYALLEGLKTKHADHDHDGQITVSELRDYVSEMVSRLTEGKQHPTSRRENIEFDFKVW